MGGNRIQRVLELISQAEQAVDRELVPLLPEFVELSVGIDEDSAEAEILEQRLEAIEKKYEGLFETLEAEARAKEC